MLPCVFSSSIIALCLQAKIMASLSTETAPTRSLNNLQMSLFENQLSSETTIFASSATGISPEATATTLPETKSFSSAAANSVYEPMTFVLDDLEGIVEWKDNGNNSLFLANLAWLISLPPDKGVVIQVTDAVMTDNCTFVMYRGNTTNPESRLRDQFVKDFPPEPVLVPSSQVLFVVQKLTPVSDGTCRFQMTYSAQSLLSMPAPVSSSDWMQGSAGVLSRIMYNCSSSSVVIPQVLLCDMVQQCVAGEDEASCDYLKNGCDGWIGYRNDCYKIAFRNVNLSFPGSLLTGEYIFPAYAKYLCQSIFKANLGSFTDLESRELIVALTRRAGFTGVKLAIILQKAKTVNSKLSTLYRFMWQWGGRGSPIAYQQTHTQRTGISLDCACLSIDEDGPIMHPYGCESQLEGYVCMKDKSHPRIHFNGLPGVVNLSPPTKVSFKFPTKVCGDGSHVHIFHPCPVYDDEDAFTGWSQNGFSLFRCVTLGQQVHFTLLCDGKPDCADQSDEARCSWARLPPIHKSFFTCRKFQLIAMDAVCNGVPECFDESDEENCFWCKEGMVRCPGRGCLPISFSGFLNDCRNIYSLEEQVVEPNTIWPPAVVELDGLGMSNITALAPGESCPESHFQCPNGYCIPTYLLNNSEQDCPQGEDEGIANHNLTCPGFYRCYGHNNCVHSKYICDGVPHCPNKDDELYCNLTCPPRCTCEGYAFKCIQMFSPLEYPQVRYLDLSGTPKPQLTNFRVMEYLFFLNLSRCALTSVLLQDLPRLQVLDLSFNDMKSLESFKLEALEGLRHLNISGNSFLSVIDTEFTAFIQTAGAQALRTLSLRSVGLRSVKDRSMGLLSKLTALDLRGNPLNDFKKGMLEGLVNLYTLWADNPKLCCSYFQQVTIQECYAPEDELSSCNDLLRSDFFRISLWVLSVLAILGNTAVLIYRLCVEKRDSSSPSFRVLVINLCVSDLMMGLYLTIIGVADIHFRGVYVSEEEEWKQSSVCKMAGFLSFVSSETSALLIVLISLDRLLVLRFPFALHLQLNARTAMAACGVVWIVGLLLATIPFLPFTADWEFYSQNAICLPLPITRKTFRGENYAFSLFVVFNFTLFLIIGVGQVYIFYIIRGANRAARKQRRSQEKAIASRLLLVVFSNFCCSFPVSVMGLLASSGIAIEGVVNIWAAIFLLPFNAALDPFLYTLNIVLDRRQKKMVDRRVERVLNQLHLELSIWPSEKLDELFRECVRTLPPEKLELWMNSEQRPQITMESSTSNVSSNCQNNV